MEILVRYKGEVRTIGENDDLYYTSFQKYRLALKKGLLSPLTGQPNPEMYARQNGIYRFRFPFPDEDRLPFGDIGNFPKLRGLKLKIDPGTDTRFIEQARLLSGQNGFLEITQQKLVYQNARRKFSLVLLVRNPESGNSFRIEDENLILKLNRNIIRSCVIGEKDQARRSFYLTLTERILQGYRRKIPVKLARYAGTGKQTKTLKARTILM